MRLRSSLVVLALLAACAASAVAQVAVQPQLDVTQFPQSGLLRQAPTLSGYTLDATGVSGATKVVVCSLATGRAGILRDCTVVVDGGPYDAFNQGLMLDIFYDGHTSADVSVPWACLFGLETASTDTAGIVKQGWDAGFFALPEPPITTGAYGAHKDHACYVLRWPIPVTNGVVVKFRAASGSYSLWVNWQWQEGLPACWNRNYRFFAERTSSSLSVVGGVPTGNIKIDAHGNVTAGTSFSGTFSSANVGRYLYGTSFRSGKVNLWEAEILARPSTTTLTIDSLHLHDRDPLAGTELLDPTYNTAFNINPAHTFLNRPAGEDGYVVAVLQGWTGASVFNYLEGNTRFKLAGAASPFHEATGTEDFFGHAFYFEWRSLNTLVGVPCYSASTKSVTAYRLLRLHYTSGCVGVWPALVQPVTSKVTVVYYRRMT